MRGIVLLFLVGLCAGCKFNSNLKVKVEVYDGHGIERVDYAPDPREVALSAKRLVRTSEESAKQFKSAISEVEKANLLFQKFLEEVKAVRKGLVENPKYLTQTNAFFTICVDAAKALLALKGTADLKASAVSEKLKASAAKMTTNVYTIDGVDVSTMMFGAALRQLSKDLTKEQYRAAQKALGALKEYLVHESRREQASTRLLALLDDQAVGLTTVAGAQKTVAAAQAVAVGALGIEPLVARTTAELSEIKAASGRVDAALAGMRTAEAALAETASKAATEEFDPALLDRQTTALLAASEAFAASFGPHVDTLVERADQLKKQLNNQTKRTYLAALAAKIPQATKDNIAATVKQGPLLDGVADALATAVTRLKSTTVHARQRVDTEDGNVRASTRLTPFQVADPNLKVITSEEGFNHWNVVPLDIAKASGDGESQYIIVQDGPTNYRIKEVHVDPTGVVGLQLTFAEIGFGILKEVASAAAGVDLPGKDKTTGETTTPTTVSDAATMGERERHFQERLRAAVLSFRASLQELKGQLNEDGTADKVTQTTALKAAVDAFQRRVDAIVTEAQKASTGEGDEKDDQPADGGSAGS